MQPEHFDAFMRDLTPLFLCDARLGYRELGRGVLVVGFPNKNSGKFVARYVPVREALFLRFSVGWIRAAREYDPDSEAVLFVECGKVFKLLKVSCEGGAVAAPAFN